MMAAFSKQRTNNCTFCFQNTLEYYDDAQVISIKDKKHKGIKLFSSLLFVCSYLAPEAKTPIFAALRAAKIGVLASGFNKVQDVSMGMKLIPVGRMAIRPVILFVILRILKE